MNTYVSKHEYLQFARSLYLVLFFFNFFQHKSRHLKDVQIMTLEDGEDLDHSRGETFRREGGAEILELDQVNWVNTQKILTEI